MATLDYEYLSSLVKRAQVGDSDAFAELYVATYQQQYAFSYRYLRDEYLAQDAIQETYILVLKNIHTLREPKVFVSWLNQINMRVCFDMVNKMHLQEVEMERYTENYIASKSVAFDQISPETESIKVDQKQYIIHQVMALPFPESQVIILRYYRNMKIGEIAKLMEVSQSSVKRYLNNGRARLAKTIER